MSSSNDCILKGITPLKPTLFRILSSTRSHKSIDGLKEDAIIVDTLVVITWSLDKTKTPPLFKNH